MLVAKIHADLIAAQKAADSAKVSVLRMLIAALKNREIEIRYLQNTGKEVVGSFEPSGEMSDQEVTGVIQKEVKEHLESIEAFTLGKREDLVAKESTELSILEIYLPPKMAEEDIVAEVKQIMERMAEGDRKNFGLVMRAAMAELRGRVDGGEVQRIVKEIIG